MIIIDVCLSDIPADNRKKSEKNNKWYTQIVVNELKEIDKFGNSHCVYTNQTKEEREAKKERVYIGKGKQFLFNQQQQPTQQQTAPQAQQYVPEQKDELPF
jgi:hypothetical protein